MAHYIGRRRLTTEEAWKITRLLCDLPSPIEGVDHDCSCYQCCPIRGRDFSPINEGVAPVKNVSNPKSLREKNETAEKNALMLIYEEEQAKIKAERKKVKKERQKEKKKQACTSNLECNDNTVENISNDINHSSINSESVEAEEFDINAAFVSKSFKKAKHPVEPKIQQTIQKDQNIKKQIKDIDSIIQMGLEYENKEHFKEAIQYYSEVLDLAPKRVDILLKRSLIYYKVASFEKSIRDAKKVLQLSPNNVEAYYRIGEGNFALNNLTDAEEAFTNLINLRSHIDCSNKRLVAIRVKQLTDMGFNPNDAFTALSKSENRTLDEALEYLSSLEKVENVSEETYYSDEEEDDDDNDEDFDEASGVSEATVTPTLAPPPSPPTPASPPRSAPAPPPKPSVNSAAATVQAPAKPALVIGKNNKVLKDSSNPFGCRSLFVANLKKDITSAEIYDLFIKFGEIVTVNLITEPNCYAFVDYRESSSAGCAMRALGGSRWLLSTGPLVVKFPVKAVNQAIPLEKKNEILNSSKKLAPVEEKRLQPKPQPQAEECYYWRNNGCKYGDKCFNLHIPEHEGVMAKNLTQFYARLGKSAIKPS